MSSGKATVRSIAKHNRRKTQDRRVMAKWLLERDNFREFTKRFNKGLSFRPVGLYVTGIGERIDRFLKENGFFDIRLPEVRYNGPLIILVNPQASTKILLQRLDISYFINGTNIEINRAQEIEPKPVKVRTPKPLQEFKPIKYDMGLCSEIIMPLYETDNEQAARLMTDIRKLDKDRLHAEMALDEIENKLKDVKASLKSLMADYL